MPSAVFPQDLAETEPNSASDASEDSPTTAIKAAINVNFFIGRKNRKTLHVFIWLLISANVTDHEFEHETIHRGQVATSLGTLANQCCLTINEVRTTLQHLKSTGEVTITRRPRYLVITISQYDRYQNSTGRITGNSHANHTQFTRKPQQYKNDKNGKNGKKNKGRSAPDSPAGENPVEEVPEEYRDQFGSLDEYLAWRNQ